MMPVLSVSAAPLQPFRAGPSVLAAAPGDGFAPGRAEDPGLMPRVRSSALDGIPGRETAVEKLRALAAAPVSALLSGAPGTGKSTLARALAADVEASGRPVVRLRGFGLTDEVFAQAFADARGGLVVLDDADVPLRNRDAMTARFLHEVESGSAVLVVTDRPDLLDPAVRSALHTQIGVEGPRDARERTAILSAMVQERGWSLEPRWLQDACAALPGRNAGDLVRLLDESSAEAARRGRTAVTEDELIEGRLHLLYGDPRVADTPAWFFRLSVAHELGHAVVRDLMQRMSGKPWEAPQSVDVISFQPRGATSAFVSLVPSGPARTLEWYFGEIASNYGGQAAEVLFGDGQHSAGPGNDLGHATRLAREAVMEFGMGATVGGIRFVGDGPPGMLPQTEADQVRLQRAAEEAAYSAVHMYSGFIREVVEEMSARRERGQSLHLTGRELTRRLDAWLEGRAEQKDALCAHFRQKLDEVRPRPPQVFDAATGATRPAAEVAGWNIAA